MQTSDLLKKVRKIEIKTRGLSNNIFSGEYSTAFKGRGMTFAEVREYQPGDDIRTIDWNVTARFNTPFVKVFEEEREMTVMLLVDVSGSGDFGTQKQLKKDLITELCAVIAFSSIQNNDKIGVIFFSDKIEKFIPPTKGKSHVLRIIRDSLEIKPSNVKTDISFALKYLTNVIRKKCIAFVISDFIDKDFSSALKITNKKHDLIALQIRDPRELELPDVGLIKLRDAESHELVWVDSSNKNVRDQYAKINQLRDANLHETFTKCGVDVAYIKTNEPYIKPITNLFKRR